ncbi:MAG TPA: flagellar biosynthetic protein FliO [Candidatus Binatia bacterium]|jgi:flagellar biogenesis protein FliO
MIGSEFATPALMVAGAVAVAVFSRHLRPFFQQKSGRQDFPRHLGTLMLNPKCSVALVQAGEERLLLGLTASNVTLLTKLGPVAEEARPQAEKEPNKESNEEIRLQ